MEKNNIQVPYFFTIISKKNNSIHKISEFYVNKKFFIKENLAHVILSFLKQNYCAIPHFMFYFI
jgi:hypothetical protein